MAEQKEVVKIRAKYERDSKNYHLYQLKGSDEIVGSIYIAKITVPFPKLLEIELFSK